MALGAGSYGLGFVAGLLSTLSPCVLPIVPILLGSAAAAHRWAPLALAGGLACSYAFVGTALAWGGSQLAFDPSVLRVAGAVVLGLLGLVLWSTTLQQRVAVATSGIGNAGHHLLDRLRLDGLVGQFAIGVTLGVVWSPCVGPTLGAAVLLASQGSQLPQVALLMGLFGLGAALPVALLAFVSASALARVRGTLLAAGRTGKRLFGAVLVGVAVLILTQADKPVEAWLLDRSPDWLTQLTTRF